MRKFTFIIVALTLSSMVFAQTLQHFPKVKQFAPPKSSDKAYVTTLGYCDDVTATGVGLGPSTPAVLTAAIEFTAADLNAYVGNYITEIHLAIQGSAAVINSAKILIIENPLTTPVVVREQNVTLATGWNELLLTSPYEIGTTPIFVAYWIDITGGYPIGASSPGGEPKADWVRIAEGDWAHLSGFGLDYRNQIRAVVDTEGTFDQAIATLSPTFYDAGAVALGQQVTSQNFTLKNDGVGSLTVSSISTLSGSWSTTFNPGAVNLSAGQTYTFTITFNPAEEGFLLENLEIETNVGTRTVEMVGQGINTTECSLLHFPLPEDLGLAVYSYQNDAGYIAGTNTYGDLAKAEFFTFPVHGEVSALYVLLGSVDGPNGNVTFTIWDGGAEPGAVLGTKVVPMSELLAAYTEIGALYIVTFDNPITVTGDFYAGAQLPVGSGFSFLTTEIDALPNTGWEQWDDSDWYSYLDAVGISLTHAIFAEICPTDVNAGITEVSNISVFPNPASEMIMVANAENSTITVVNILGEVVSVIENATANQMINISSLANGTYFVKVNTEVFKINVVK